MVRMRMGCVLAVVGLAFGIGGSSLFGQKGRDNNSGDEAGPGFPHGTLRGQVFERRTQMPLEGVSVSIESLERQSTTDSDGRYLLEEIPVGSYTLVFRLLGYRPFARTDVIVRPDRITFVNSELDQVAVEVEGLLVVAGGFPEEESQPVSVIGYSGEEIRRAPGSGGDVSRIIASLPSLAKVNDQTNSLIVRGGSPIENAFYVDNIEIPNINHFPTQGASGGPIGLINVDFIESVDFRAGGFSATYGDRLSSIMDIEFREGNREEFDGQLDLNFTGFGGVFEGPLPGNTGSWMVSGRRSYRDLLIKMVDAGSSVAPRFGDYQGKVVIDPNDSHRLSFLAVFADDHMSSDSTVAVENAMVYFGDQDLWTGTVGVNWRALWGYGMSNTSLAYSTNRFDERFSETTTGMFLTRNQSSESAVSLRNVNRISLSASNSIEFGLDAKYLDVEFDNLYAAHTDAVGNPIPEARINSSLTEGKLGAFSNVVVSPFEPLTATFGMRVDHFTFNDETTFSPRFSFKIDLTDRTSINGATGIYYQSLPMVLLAQSSSNSALPNSRSIHYVLGMSRLLSDYTKLSLELYHKDYIRAPIDPSQSSLFLIDELFYRYGFYSYHEQLVATGQARSSGIEVTLQKRLHTNVYGLVSGSYSRIRYMGGDSVWRDRVFDNRLILGVEGGYKPNNSWEFSARWLYAGGAPYTPFDIERTREENRAVLDATRINTERYPDYHSLNVRFDRRFYFGGSNLIVYLSVWNAYNRKNVASYYWNEVDSQVDLIYQWSLLPIFGLEYEF